MAPTPEKILADLGEPIYGLARAVGARIAGSGYRGGNGGRVVSVNLHFDVRGRKGQIDVRTSLDDDSRPFSLLFDAVTQELFSLAEETDYPLRIEIDRSETRIPVDGSEQPFVAYVCRNTVAAVSQVGDRWIRVRCPLDYLPNLELSSLSREDLENYLSARGS